MAELSLLGLVSAFGALLQPFSDAEIAHRV